MFDYLLSWALHQINLIKSAFESVLVISFFNGPIKSFNMKKKFQMSIELCHDLWGHISELLIHSLYEDKRYLIYLLFVLL